MRWEELSRLYSSCPDGLWDRVVIVFPHVLTTKPTLPPGIVPNLWSHRWQGSNSVNLKNRNKQSIIAKVMNERRGLVRRTHRWQGRRIWGKNYLDAHHEHLKLSKNKFNKSLKYLIIKQICFSKLNKRKIEKFSQFLLLIFWMLNSL